MSTAAAAAAPTEAEAPWRSLFLEHVGSMRSPVFTLGTVRRERLRRRAAASSGGVLDEEAEVVAITTTTPRTRTCVFRGLWASLAAEADARNEAPQNPPAAYASDLPVFTTDARMDKMAELFGEVVDVEEDYEEEEGEGGPREKERGGDGARDDDDLDGLPPLRFPGSGGGAPVEAVFWPEAAMVQWRVRGRAYVLGPEIETSEAGRRVSEAVGARMRRPAGQETGSGGGGDGWSWAREVTAHFGNLGPGMRGTFRNPPPGTPVALPVPGGDGAGLGLGQRVPDLHDPVARRHFRVVVIVPDEVDRTDLSDPARARRWLYYYRGGDGAGASPRHPGGQVVDGWEKVEVWP